MKIWAVSMVRDEADIIAYTISHLLAQDIDGIIICEHRSEDGTMDILSDIAAKDKRVMIRQEASPAFYQGRKLTELAHEALNHGAGWVFACDADELWHCHLPGMTVGECLRRQTKNVIGVQMWNHYCTNADPVDINPYKRLAYRHVERNMLDKCVSRFRRDYVIDEGNHRILRDGVSIAGHSAPLAIRHFSARSENRWVKKSVDAGSALELTSLSEKVGIHVRGYKQTAERFGMDALKEHWRRHFFFTIPSNVMVHDPAPYAGLL